MTSYVYPAFYDLLNTATDLKDAHSFMEEQEHLVKHSKYNKEFISTIAGEKAFDGVLKHLEENRDKYPDIDPDRVRNAIGFFSSMLEPEDTPITFAPPCRTLQEIMADIPSVEVDPNGRKPNEPGAKLDSGKVRPWLCIAGFSRALEEVAKVTTKGAEKYTPNGWSSVPEGVDRYMEAAVRHLMKLGQGKIMDDEPGGLGDTYHKAQVAWNILASLELELREKNDNSQT